MIGNKFKAFASTALGLVMIAGAAMAEQDTSGDVIYLDQGWSEEQRQFFYHASQGTAMLPLAFYKNLEQADSQELFSNDANIRSLGLQPGKVDEKLNPDGLPIGLALRSVEDGLFTGDWVGFTCSSCHSGDLYYQGKQVRIEGGSNHIFSMPRFANALRKATHATASDSAKLGRLLQRAKEDIDLPPAELLSELQTISQYLDYFVDRVAASAHDFGPGRMDALNQIHNTINGVYLNIPENLTVTGAPTKSPFVWNAPQSAWVQWSGILDKPLTRNLGESLGAMVRVNLEEDAGDLFESTVDLGNQLQIEANIWELSPPVWPSEIFGEIDRDLSARGKELVAENCASCHTSAPYRWSGERKAGKRFVENALVPQTYVGTDPMQHLSPAVDPNPVDFTGIVAPLLPNPFTGDKLAPPSLIQDSIKAGVVEKYLPKLGLSEDSTMAAYNYTDPDDPSGGPTVASYKAAPLEGMWSVPPYLHNNSVPSIYHLLLPASERPTTWKQGRDFDPKTIGLDTSGNSGDFVVDTSHVGMSNKGHSFEDAPLGNGVVGRALSEDERWAIIEYMKTLPEKVGQQAPYGGPEDPALAWEDRTFFNVSNESGYNHTEGGYKASE